jgi:hypothetical protein
MEPTMIYKKCSNTLYGANNGVVDVQQKGSFVSTVMMVVSRKLGLFQQKYYGIFVRFFGLFFFSRESYRLVRKFASNDYLMFNKFSCDASFVPN